GGDLAVTQLRLALERQHLAALAHGQTSLAPPSTSPGTARKGHGSSVVLLSLPGPACRGMPARHHVESWPGMLWNLHLRVEGLHHRLAAPSTARSAPCPPETARAVSSFGTVQDPRAFVASSG